MAEIVPFAMSGPKALEIIRELPADTDRIVVIPHCRRRQNERKITRRQIELCVQKGVITEGPFVNAKGNRQVTMYRRAAGEEICCVVAIDWPSRVLVITTF